MALLVQAVCQHDHQLQVGIVHLHKGFTQQIPRHQPEVLTAEDIVTVEEAMEMQADLRHQLQRLR